MRKILPIVILLFAATAASLKAEPVVSIPEGMLGLTGEVVAAPIEIDDATGVVAIDCIIDYDTTLLDLSNADVSLGSLIDGWSIQKNVVDADGRAKIAAFTTIPLSGGSGSLFELNFHVIGSSGKCTLDLSGALNEGLVSASFDFGSILISAGPPIPGDANVDNKVNEADAAILSTNWQVGPGATWGMGNFNGDGYVDDADATMMAANWHYGVTANASVPEPGMVVLLATALSGLLFRRVSK